MYQALTTRKRRSVSAPLVPAYVRSSPAPGVGGSPNSRKPSPRTSGTICTMISSSRPRASTWRATSAPNTLTARPSASSSARASPVSRSETPPPSGRTRAAPDDASRQGPVPTRHRRRFRRPHRPRLSTRRRTSRGRPARRRSSVRPRPPACWTCRTRLRLSMTCRASGRDETVERHRDVNVDHSLTTVGEAKTHRWRLRTSSNSGRCGRLTRHRLSAAPSDTRLVRTGA
jgi:hypothetical protein